MVTAGWQALADECARWQADGRVVEFWWRDDDAAQATPALQRLLALAESAQVPLALAAVPLWSESAMCARLGPLVSLLQHGMDHRNRARDGERKTEFPALEPTAEALTRLAEGRARLRALSRGRLLDVLVPPWNRLPAQLIPQLAGAGFRGVSRYGARAGREAAPGLLQLNTHVDIIAWNAGRGFTGPETALAQAARHLAARRAGECDAGEPTGWLTHHACHDEAAWHFLAELFDATRRLPGVQWIDARDFFGPPNAP